MLVQTPKYSFEFTRLMPGVCPSFGHKSHNLQAVGLQGATSAIKAELKKMGLQARNDGAVAEKCQHCGHVLTVGSWVKLKARA